MTTPFQNKAVRQERAFTLIEVLLAMAVFAIVLAAIHMVFYGGLRLRNRSAEAIEKALPLEHTIAVMQRDLANLVLTGGTLFGELQTTPMESALSTNALDSMIPDAVSVPGQSSPGFFTTSGLLDEIEPWGEVQRVSYFLAEPTNSSAGLELFRSVTRNLLPVLPDEPDHQFLMGGLESLAFYYYDGTQWLEYWDSTSATNKLPCAIKVELQLVREPGDRSPRLPVEIVVPVVVRAGTNEIAQTEEEGGA
jgi:type II secretion system protein J